MAGAGRQFIINLIANSEGATKAFNKVAQAIGRIPTPVAAAGAAMTATFAAVTASVLKVGSEFAKLGEEFNSAYSIIRNGTGAVGDDFEALQESFRTVAGNVSDSFDDVATAITEVDTRLDLMSNRRLERVSQQFLDLAGVTGGDLAGTIRGVTRMFNRFGVEAHMTSDMLDFMFRATQATGVSVEDLGKQTTDYGAQLMRLGFDLEEAIVFLGMMEREGASITRIMPSLNTAAQKLAGEGVTDITQGMMDFIDELRTLDDEAAELRAMQILGGQYGNFLQLVRDNNVDFSELMRIIADGDATISDAAAETDGLRDAWDGFLNFLKLQFEEPATIVFENLKEVINSLKPLAQEVQDAYEEEGLAGALDVLQAEWNRIYEENIEPIWQGFLDFLEDTVLPEAIRIGSEIGIGIARAIWDKFTETMRSFFWSEEIAANVGSVDIMNEMGIIAGTGPQMPRTPFPTPGNSNPEPLPLPAPGGGGVGQIRLMAEGGIVSSPTLAVIGEAGPEAVVPLDRLGSGGNVVNVYVNGGDPEAVVDAIRRYTRANGPLGQVVQV